MTSRLQSALGEFRESLGLLTTRRYGSFWFASFLSNIGTWAQLVAEPWLMLSIGATPVLIGLDSFAMNAPAWALTLVGGVLADRADRRRVIALFQSIQMLCPTAIAALLVFGTITPYEIIALSLVVGVTDALSMPSFQSITPSIVERERIGRGLALNATQFNLSRIVGPALAGVLMASVGAVACFVVSAASYIPFIGVALWILPRGAREAADDDGFDPGHPLAGFGEIVGNPRLRGALLTVLTTSVLCAPLVTFTPVLVRQTFGGDAGDFSLAIGAFGLGGLVGAISLLGVAPESDRRALSSGFALLYGCVVLLVAWNPLALAVPALMCGAGIAMSVSNTSANSIIQASAEPRLLGQTVSLFMLATRGGLPIGGLLTGISVEFLGVRPALAINGALALLAQLTVAWLWRAARQK